MNENSGDIYHVTCDAEYLRQAQAEAAQFDQPSVFNADTSFPSMQEYWNERFAGDEKVAWFETISGYATFHRGCALGTGGCRQNARILEQNPSLHLTVYDISEESLAVLEREVGSQFPGRLVTQQVDLNFAELPKNAYDLIISDGCLHHLANLEHVAYQINESLTPEGLFFLRDYVGEARFQFAEEKRRLFEAAFEESQARHTFLRSWQVVWPDLSNWNYSPFEAVRSDETLLILRRYLSEVALHTAGAIIGLLLFVKPVARPAGAPVVAVPSRWRRALARLAPTLGWRLLDGTYNYAAVCEAVSRDLVPLDRLLTIAGIFQPAFAFAVYGKKRWAEPPNG